MGIALLAVSTLARPLAALHRWWSLRSASLAGQCKQPPMQTRRIAPQMSSPKTAQSPASPSGNQSFCSPTAPVRLTASAPLHSPVSRARHPACHRLDKPFPLRVLHSHGNGRMAIAGRMAEVCAELDRLVASELPH